ncbi:MAG: phosphotransferase [Firmicutes bacterium]|nr:phosphotransferase [Bacillota bacterium]
MPNINSEKKQDNCQGNFVQKVKTTAQAEDLVCSDLQCLPSYADYVKIEPISKGLSGDQKYRLETTDGKVMFLRLADLTELDRKKAEYEMMEKAYNHGILTPQPIEFGLCACGQHCYSLSGWLEGKDAEAALPFMTETEQYALGLKTGEILRKIHRMQAPKNIKPWELRFESKLANWQAQYHSKPEIHSDIGRILLSYLDENKDVLGSRRQTFIHGDYNTENIMLLANDEIGIIDFNCFNTSYGDPWWDLNNMAWMPIMYPHFYTGQINGYFNRLPLIEFWQVLTYYLAFDALAALTDPYELNGLEDGTDIVNNILNWTNNFNSIVPTWYLRDFHIN